MSNYFDETTPTTNILFSGEVDNATNLMETNGETYDYIPNNNVCPGKSRPENESQGCQPDYTNVPESSAFGQFTGNC